MRETTVDLAAIPGIILIVGTDASGKDHLADILTQMITEAGGTWEKRKRLLTGKPTQERYNTPKSRLELLQEKLFLLFLPSLGFLLPWGAEKILRHDIKKIRRQVSQNKVVVVGHNCLRGLAFYWGHHSGSRHISTPLAQTLQRMHTIPGLFTIVLNVDDSLRKIRIANRAKQGLADHFDDYLMRNEALSVRIEETLVWLTRTYLGAMLIRNDDLPEEELRALLAQGFAKRKETW